MDLSEVKVYRMTHIDNIEHILQNGITHRNSSNHNPTYKAIGDVSLINTRDHKQILVDNGDFHNSDGTIITLGDFIPFYFGVKMPMLFVIRNGGNFVTKPTPASEIIYLVCSLNSIINNGDFYFSDGHATDNLTSFYDSSQIENLVDIVDWNAVKASYWSGQDNLNIKRKKQAEFLISDDIAPNLIVGFGCYNEIAKNMLLEFGVQENTIKVIPNAYF